MAIMHRGRQVVGVHYDMIYRDEVVDAYDTQGSGGISALIEKCDRNPGMSIRATVYAEPGEADKCKDVEILSTRVVYPPMG